MSGLVLLGGLLVACNTTSSTGSSADMPTALEVIQQDARLSTLNSLLTPDIRALLADESLQFTFFAPANDAWLPATFAQLSVGRPTGQTLENVLYYHFAPGEYSIASLKDEAAEFEYAIIDTALEDIFFAYELEDGSFVIDPGLYIDDERFSSSKFFDIKFVAEDIPTSNGIIHIIERVLLTPTVSEYAYWVFVNAEEEQEDNYAPELDEAGLFEDLLADGPFTAFLPEYVGVFEQLTKAQVDYLFEPANADLITRVINNHVVDSVQLIGGDEIEGVQLIGSDISEDLEVTTRAGETYRFVLEYDPESDLEYWTFGGIDLYLDQENRLYSEVWRNGSTLFIYGMLLPDDIASILDAL